MTEALQERAGARLRRPRLDHHLRRARHRRRADRLGERGLPGGRASSGKDKFEIVVPPLSILAEPPVAVVDKIVDKHGTRGGRRGVPEVPLHAEGQEIAAKHYYRPRDAEGRGEVRVSSSRRSSSFTIDEVFGGWQKAQRPLRRRRRLRPDLHAGRLAADPHRPSRTDRRTQPRRTTMTRRILAAPRPRSSCIHMADAAGGRGGARGASRRAQSTPAPAPPPLRRRPAAPAAGPRAPTLYGYVNVQFSRTDAPARPRQLHLRVPPRPDRRARRPQPNVGYAVLYDAAETALKDAYG